MTGELKLPGYLRLLLILYRKGSVNVKHRKLLGFDLNDVYMLQAYGLVEYNGKTVTITSNGVKWIEENILDPILSDNEAHHKDNELNDSPRLPDVVKSSWHGLEEANK